MLIVNDVIIEGTVIESKYLAYGLVHELQIAMSPAKITLLSEGTEFDRVVALMGLPVLVRGSISEGRGEGTVALRVKTIERGRPL